MPLTVNPNVFITCAITGSGNTQDRSPEVPRSPKEIAASAIAAAKAGAAIVHCHVRDPQTGVASRDPKLYRELTDRIRDSNTDVVLNLTAGMGGDMVFGPPSAPLPLHKSTDMASAETRMEPIAECLPEICTLDCGTMNFAEADYVMTNTPGMLRAMGSMMTALGVKPDMNRQKTSKQKLSGLILVISMLLLPSMVIAQIKVLDKITAIVDDDVVLQSELDQRMIAVAQGAPGGLGRGSNAGTPECHVAGITPLVVNFHHSADIFLKQLQLPVFVF